MSPKGKLKIIPLGGVEEIGKNIYVLEYADDIVILDCGSIFPKEDMLGIDLVIPDVTYLQRNRDKIRGILVTATRIISARSPMWSSSWAAWCRFTARG